MKKIYTLRQIEIAAFFGGPLVPVYMLSRNFKAFTMPRESRRTLVFGLLLIMAFMVIVAFIPRIITYYIPKGVIPVIIFLLAGQIARRMQGETIAQHLEAESRKMPIGKVILLTVLSGVITIAALLGINYSAARFLIRYNYTAYLQDYCRFDYANENIRTDLIYIPEDASCFVYDKLRAQGYSLKQVDQVLNLNGQYLQEVGIMSDFDQVISEEITYDPLPFIESHQSTGLTEPDIMVILSIEEDYLVRIGAIVPDQIP